MVLEAEHDEWTIDRREDQLPDRKLLGQSRTNPAGLEVKVEPRDGQQKRVEVEEVENPL